MIITENVFNYDMENNIKRKKSVTRLHAIDYLLLKTDKTPPQMLI